MWAYERTFYQIYPLGMCGAPMENDGVTVSRIRRVLDWGDHLEKLGVGAVVFNPVFQSDRHGYDTRDFLTVDCRLGTNQDFKDVCDDLHRRGIKVVLDGVFHHVGRGFWAFQDVLRNREGSPYKDWFHINFGGNSNYNDGLWYEGWEGHYELVKLNLRNPAVAEYLFGCIRGWVEEFGVDGLRLDVAYCLDGDFVRRLRAFTGGLKPEFVLIGEMLHGDYKRMVNGAMLHSATNYECYKGLYSSFNSGNMHEIAYSLNRQFGSEQWCLYTGKHLLSFVDNHDVSRIATILTDKNCLKPIYGLLFGMPGTPAVYYGSEWGVEGDKKNGDPTLRPEIALPEQNDLTEWITALAGARTASPALCNGSYRNVMVQPKQLIFERRCGDDRVLVAINADDKPYHADFNAEAGRAVDLITGDAHDFGGGSDLPPYSCMFWKTE